MRFGEGATLAVHTLLAPFAAVFLYPYSSLRNGDQFMKGHRTSVETKLSLMNLKQSNRTKDAPVMSKSSAERLFAPRVPD